MEGMKRYKTLFLDRDGVINVERKNDYAKNISEFIFEAEALEAMKILANKFERIFIVTNQRGVGRGVMSHEDLSSVHQYLIDNITKVGGRVSQIYTCTDVDSTSINRKPNIGMAFIAANTYPEIDFKTSIMVGNSRSDMEFGNKLGMYTVLVGNKYSEEDEIYKNICAYYPNLYQFTLSL